MQRSILKTLSEVKSWFMQNPSKVYAFDFETTGLNFLTMEPVGISFCDGRASMYCDLWENEDADSILSYLYTVLEQSLAIAHNAKFDVKCCQKFMGGIPDNLFCTYIASVLLDENRPSHSLDNLTHSLFGTGKSGKWDQYTDWHSEEFYEYATVDSELTYRLYEIFQPRLVEEELLRVFDIEMKFIPVAAEMEMNGLQVDKEALTQLQSRVEERILLTEDKMLDAVGLKPSIQEGLFGQKFRSTPVNFNSPDHLVQCFQTLKIPLQDKTPGGNPSISKESLLKLKGTPFVDMLLEYKSLRKLYSGYILPAWELIDEDGRIHPNVGIVRTGRTSMSSPNLQQLPNTRDESINYRNIFSTNGLLIGADYASQELRILGAVTQDENIIEAFKKNMDLHLYTANHIFHLDLGESALVTGSPENLVATKQFKVERYRAKNGANFPIVYGTSSYGVAHRQGVSVEMAQKWIDGFFKAYPAVKAAMDAIPTELLKNEYVSTLMGRRRRFPNFKKLPQYSHGGHPSKDRCVRQAFNACIQGFAADQAKIAGRRIYDRLKQNPQWKTKIVLLVHDEWVVETMADEYVEEVKACITDCMEHAVALSVPFKVDLKSGKTYSEIK